MSKKLYSTQDNLSLITGGKPESPLERERKAELTLLSIMETVPEGDKEAFLLESGVTKAEYERLTQKWSRVLDRYRQEKANESSQTNTI